MPDHFQTLGLDRSASDADIKKAFKTLAKQYHPDVNKDPDAVRKFQEINSAYSSISDPQKRARYEAELDMGPGFQSGGFGFSGDHDHVFRRTFNDLFGDGMFEAHFRRQQTAMNVNIRVNYQITLEESFYGKTAKLVYTAGNMPKQEVEVPIPAGINHGENIVFRGRGITADTRQPPGDLVVTIMIKPHETFRRDGLNLVTNLIVDPITPIIGGSKKVKGIDGQIIDVNIPPLFNDEYIMIPNHGMNLRNTGNRGGLFVVIERKMPDVLPDESIPLLNRLKDLFNKQ